MCDNCEEQELKGYVSEDQWFADVLAYLQARDRLNQDKEMRRMWANHQRAIANRVDVTTNLGVGEANEVLPLPIDLHPVPPVDDTTAK